MFDRLGNYADHVVRYSAPDGELRTIKATVSECGAVARFGPQHYLVIYLPDGPAADGELVTETHTRQAANDIARLMVADARTRYSLTLRLVPDPTSAWEETKWALRDTTNGTKNYLWAANLYFADHPGERYYDPLRRTPQEALIQPALSPFAPQGKRRW